MLIFESFLLYQIRSTCNVPSFLHLQYMWLKRSYVQRNLNIQDQRFFFSKKKKSMIFEKSVYMNGQASCNKNKSFIDLLHGANLSKYK